MSDMIMEENSSQGVQVPIQRFTELQAALNEISAEATRQRDRCTSLRAERKSLETAVAFLAKQQDDLRLDLVAEKEAIEWWNARDAAVPSDMRNKADTMGRAIRRAFVDETKRIEAEAHLKEVEAEGRAAVMEEQLIAQGLRDRIGRLEARLRTAEKAREEGVIQMTKYQLEAEALREEHGRSEDKWSAERADLLEARDAARKELQSVKNELEKANEGKRDALEEARRARVQADIRLVPKSPARPLTPIKANIPGTPTRSSHTTVSAPTDRSPPKSTAPLTPASLARRYTYLEGRHAVLHKEYEALKAKHTEDTQRWIQYKEALTAREEIKRQKRAKRRADRVASEAAADVAPTSTPSSGLPPTFPTSCNADAADSGDALDAERVERDMVLVEESDNAGQTRTIVPPTPPRPSAGAAIERKAAVPSGPSGQPTTAYCGASNLLIADRATVPPAGMPAGPEQNNVIEEEEYEEPEYCSPADAAFHHTASQRSVLEVPDIEVATTTLGPHTASRQAIRQDSPSSPVHGNDPQQPLLPHQTPHRVQTRQMTATSPVTSRQDDQRRDERHTRTEPRTKDPASSNNLQTPTSGPALGRSESRGHAQRLLTKSESRGHAHQMLGRTESRGHQHAQSTPRGTTIAQASRTTPWLGKAIPVGRSGSRSDLQTNRNVDDDPFASPPDAGDVEISTTPAQKLLIRDRGVREERNEQPLLRSVLRSGHMHEDRGFGGESSTGHVVGDSTTERAKRKASELDAELAVMSPAEKSAMLKRLRNLPQAERDKVYAQYKGQGRYVAPEDVQTGVGGQYEIDPKLNEGHAHQFHDVKRSRAERRKMHGGECECCKEYYQAIGDIPRYNQAPKWNDGPAGADTEAEADADARVRDHQNLVSRHRETWKKAPTPPEYWAIGFPNTQDVARQNREADRMEREKAERIRQEVEQGQGKWRKKRVSSANKGQDGAAGGGA